MFLEQTVLVTREWFIPSAGPTGRKMGGRGKASAHEITSPYYKVSLLSKETNISHQCCASPVMPPEEAEPPPGSDETQPCSPNAAFAEWKQGGPGKKEAGKLSFLHLYSQGG